ncbi:MED7 protein [Dictyocaulus viviparus]|uniref:Mediator of RNA polymerase II transcription subunit 7 n=1 Tax=Dictyocaulus viviparus TaxID=29172 RepID=A0A0D8XEL0_DICVI|nr:MED7 protein [Dictyocaulus viviparus]
MNQAAGALAVSPFPAPPEYAHHYTTERVNQGAVLPPPPVQTVFTVFGEEYRLEDDIIRSLASQNIKQLYPTKYDWKTEMKKLNRSVVVAFLDLLDILVRCPDHPERNEKINDIQTIFINMHHLINEYRPLQARDTLRMVQSQQLKELKKTVKRFKGHLEAGKSALREELSLSDLKLTPVPRPSPLTGIDIDSDEENMPVLVKMELSDVDETAVAMSMMRCYPRPSRIQLKQRRNADTQLLFSEN